MKTNKIINILLSGLLVTLFSSCTDDFTKINTDTRSLKEIDDINMVGAIYGSVQYNGLMNGWDFQTSQNLFADLYSEYYANWHPVFPSDRLVIVTDWLNGAWGGFYGQAAKNLAVTMETIDPSKPENVIFEKAYALCQIWKVFMYQRITDYWGPIPYSAVNNGVNAVPYDPQDAIYADFIVLLDAATTTLAKYTGESVFGANDQIYGGSVDKWITFANTLRLRVGMRLSKVDPTRAKTQCEKAVADGVMTSNADNAIFQTSPASFNALCIMLPWNEFRMSATMESVLKGYADPRLSSYFAPAVATGQYKGMRNGYATAQLALPERHFDQLSRMADRWGLTTNQSTTPIEVILASEAYFLRAEGALKGWNMDITAEEAYNQGIAMSLAYWGSDAATIAAYQESMNTPIATNDAPALTDIPVKWDAADPAKQLEQVMTQKWLALYPDGWEAWGNLRRTGLPKLFPRINSDNPDVPKEALMRRVGYVPSEYSSNLDELNKGITLLGGPDKGLTRLWWDPAK